MNIIQVLNICTIFQQLIILTKLKLLTIGHIVNRILIDTSKLCLKYKINLSIFT